MVASASMSTEPAPGECAKREGWGTIGLGTGASFADWALVAVRSDVDVFEWIQKFGRSERFG